MSDNCCVGCRLAALARYALVKLSSAGAYRLTAIRATSCFEMQHIRFRSWLRIRAASWLITLHRIYLVD